PAHGTTCNVARRWRFVWCAAKGLSFVTPVPAPHVDCCLLSQSARRCSLYHDVCTVGVMRRSRLVSSTASVLHAPAWPAGGAVRIATGSTCGSSTMRSNSLLYAAGMGRDTGCVFATTRLLAIHLR